MNVQKALIVGLTLAAFSIAAADAATRPGTAPSGTSQVKKCKKGEIWNKRKKKCQKVGASLVPDDEMIWQGRELALAGEFDWAIDVLSAVRDKSNPEALNYLGYANRKAGRLDAGIAYYQKALAIDPNYVLVREYLGEGYVSAGKIELAKDQLNEIGKRCGTGCEEYADPAEAIAKSKTQ
jgi:tetratricopeptide (TPR) repeat protein